MRRSKRGYAIMTVIGLMVISGFVVYSALTLTRSRTRSAHGLIKRTCSRWAAEGALEICISQFLRLANDPNSSLFDDLRLAEPLNTISFAPDDSSKMALARLGNSLGREVKLNFQGLIHSQLPFLPADAYPHKSERAFTLTITGTAEINGIQATAFREYSGRTLALAPPVAGLFSLWVDTMPEEPNYKESRAGRPRIAITSSNLNLSASSNSDSITSPANNAGRIHIGSPSSINIAWESDSHLLPQAYKIEKPDYTLLQYPSGICSHSALDPAFQNISWSRIPSGPSWLNITSSGLPDKKGLSGAARFRHLIASAIEFKGSNTITPLPAGKFNPTASTPSINKLPVEVKDNYHNYASRLNYLEFSEGSDMETFFRGRQFPRNTEELKRALFSRSTRIVENTQELLRLFSIHDGHGFVLNPGGNVIVVNNSITLPPIQAVISSGMIISKGMINLKAIPSHNKLLTFIATGGDINVEGEINCALISLGKSGGFHGNSDFYIGGLLMSSHLHSPFQGGIIEYMPRYGIDTPESINVILSPLIHKESVSFRRRL